MAGVAFRDHIDTGTVAADLLDDKSSVVIIQANELSYLRRWQHYFSPEKAKLEYIGFGREL
jgi:hypothetical protein